MAVVTITVRLPEELVRDAGEFNIITDEEIAVLVQQELDRRVNDFVNAEIHAYRAEKRTQATSDEDA